MEDRVFEAFLNRQWEEATALARCSDLVEVVPERGAPPTDYRVTFRCKSLVGSANAVEETSFCQVGVSFPADYLRRVGLVGVLTYQTLTWLGPPDIWHPNIRAPFVCIGPVAPGTGLVELIYRLFDVITFNNVTMREDNALNKEACIWARRHIDRFPIDRRPLKRRTLNLGIEREERQVSP